MTRILPRWETPDGWTILTVAHTSVPGYDLAAASKGLTEDAVQRELLLNWNVVVGRACLPEFSVARHVAIEPLVFDPELPLHIGWDWGSTPACCITQLSHIGQWKVFPSISPSGEKSIGIYDFAQQVADHLLREYATPNSLGLEELNLVHIGDPAGAGPPPTTAGHRRETRSCFEILYRGLDIDLGDDDFGDPVVQKRPGFGWRVIPGAVGISARLEAVRGRLRTEVNSGQPGMVVDPRATTVIEALSGAYAYKEFADGTYGREPEKSFWSHTADALCYIATRLFVRPYESDGEDEELKPEGFRGAASGAHRGGYR